MGLEGWIDENEARARERHGPRWVRESSFYDALQQEKLQPAGTPSIEPSESSAEDGLAYTAVFDRLLRDLKPELEKRPE